MIALESFSMPEGVHYDGEFESSRGRFRFFTDAETGSSFCTPVADTTAETIAAARDEVRARFAEMERRVSRSFNCTDRMCGADDCETCRGDAAIAYRRDMAREASRTLEYEEVQLTAPNGVKVSVELAIAWIANEYIERERQWKPESITAA